MVQSAAWWVEVARSGARGGEGWCSAGQGRAVYTATLRYQ